MAGDRFITLDVSGFQTSLHDLHARVASGCGRIEVTCADSDQVCVLISKAELECLERALDILSATDGYKGMCDEVRRAATQSGSGVSTAALPPEAPASIAAAT